MSGSKHERERAMVHFFRDVSMVWYEAYDTHKIEHIGSLLKC